MAYSKNRRLAEIVSDTSGNLSVEGIVVPTQSNSDNDTSAASTAFVHAHIDAVLDSAPGTLNTLNEIAAALNDDANFNTTVTNSIAAKLPLSGGTLTGNIAHASDFTLDVGGDINLDADGADINLKDGGTAMGRLGFENGDLNIASAQQDYDIRLKGNDGGSVITALHLDMSNAGDALFNNRVFTSGGTGANTSTNADDIVIGLNNNSTERGITIASTVGGGIRWNDGADAGTLQYVHSSNEMQFYTAGALATVIDGLGNVGIGTNNPRYLLEARKDIDSFVMKIENDGNSAGTSGASYADASDGLWVDTRWNTATNTPFKVTSNSGSSPMMIIKGNGNVGIGTDAPGYQVHIKKTGSAEIEIEGTVSAELNLHDSGGTANQRRGRLTQNGAGFKLQALNDADDAVTHEFITMDCATGNVGIGTTSPVHKLDVRDGTIFAGRLVSDEGSISYTNTAAAFSSRGVAHTDSRSNVLRLLRDGTSGVVYAGYADFDLSRWEATGVSSRSALTIKLGHGNAGSSETDVMTLRSNGNVGIGTTSPATTLHLDASGGAVLRMQRTSSNATNKLELSHDGTNGSISSTNNLTISAASTTFNSTALIQGVSNYTGLEVKGSGGSRPMLKFTNVNNGNLAGIYGTEANSMVLTSGSSNNAAVEIDSIGHVDTKIAGSRMTSHVQDSFHIGAEKSHAPRYSFGSGRTYVDGGSSNYAGYVFTNENYFPSCWVPYSPNQVYRISASMYQLTGSTASGGATSRHYFGLAGYDENFNFVQVDAIGTYQYILGANFTISAGNFSEMDVTMKGWQGSGGSDGNKMDQGTVYIRPLILFNYQNAGATAVLTGFNIQPAGTVADNDSNAGTNY